MSNRFLNNLGGAILVGSALLAPIDPAYAAKEQATCSEDGFEKFQENLKLGGFCEGKPKGTVISFDRDENRVISNVQLVSTPSKEEKKPEPTQVAPQNPNLNTQASEPAKTPEVTLAPSTAQTQQAPVANGAPMRLDPPNSTTTSSVENLGPKPSGASLKTSDLNTQTAPNSATSVNAPSKPADTKLKDDKEKSTLSKDFSKRLDDALGTTGKTKEGPKGIKQEPLDPPKDFSDAYHYFIKRGDGKVIESFKIPENYTAQERNLAIDNKTKLPEGLDFQNSYVISSKDSKLQVIGNLRDLERTLKEGSIHNNQNTEIVTFFSGYSSEEIAKELKRLNLNGTDLSKITKGYVGFNPKVHLLDADNDNTPDKMLIGEDGNVKVKFGNGKATTGQGIPLMDFFRTYMLNKTFQGNELAQALELGNEALAYLYQNNGSQEDIALIREFQNNATQNTTTTVPRNTTGKYVISLGGRNPSIYDAGNGTLTKINDFSAQNNWDITLSRYSKPNMGAERVAVMYLDKGMNGEQYDLLASSFGESYVKGLKGYRNGLEFVLNVPDLGKIVAGESCLGSGDVCSTRTVSQVMDGAFGNGLTDGAKIYLHDDAKKSTVNGDVTTTKFDLTVLAKMINPDNWHNQYNVAKWILPLSSLSGIGNGHTWFNENPFFAKQRDIATENCPKSPINKLVKCGYEAGAKASIDFLGGKR